MTPPALHGFYLLTRTGFEAEGASEANDLAAQCELPGYAQTTPGSALVIFRAFEPFKRLPDPLTLPNWVFARQLVPLLGECSELDPSDRLGPVLALLGDQVVSGIVAETPDTNDGKALSGLGKSLTNAARQLLKQRGQYHENDRRLPRLHLLLLAGTHLLVGLSRRGESSPDAGGIMHLKLPKDAPSRAILKLEEAAITLLSGREADHWLRPGMSAVDLGAAPGGWTWWLTRQGMQVTAIDNADMNDAVMKTGQVEHIRADGFAWRPRFPVHLVCCDMVEQPQRVTARMAEWLEQGWAQAALFNLKLPMKKRYAMVQECFALLHEHLGESHQLRARHLYHDREEITVCLLPAPDKRH